MKKIMFPRILLLLFIVWSCLPGPMGCGQGDRDNETGSVIINLLEADGNANKKSSTSKAPLTIDCEEISTVEINIYNEEGKELTGGSFLCDARTGTVDDIPVGSIITCMVSVKNRHGSVVYRGTENGITIQEGQNTVDVVMMRVDETETTVTISAPAEGTEYVTGDDITLMGSAVDALDGTLDGEALVWTISQNDQIDQIGTGTPVNFSTDNYTAGTYTLTLTATARDNTSSESSITIQIKQNNAPEVALSVSPSSDNGEYLEGTAITFTGTVTDRDETIPVENYVWTDGLEALGSGVDSITRNDLSSGSHTITLTVTDSHGVTGSASLDVIIKANELPVARISQPQGGTFHEGDEIIFRGSGTDPEDGQLTDSQLQWTSCIDNSIGSGTELTRSDLSPGHHLITLTVTDNDGDIDTDTTQIFVNELPEAHINAPQGGTFLEGQTISFEGSGTDSEDGTLEGEQLEWESSIDGSLGQNTSVDINNLSPGGHTITLTVTDDDGGVDTDTIQINIWTLLVFNNFIGMDFNLIPAGTFTMGSPVNEPGRDSDETQHTVTLTRSFYIQTTEVTQGQWKAIMGEGSNPSDFPECGDDCPVEAVSWYDAVVFCNRLSEQEGLTPTYYADDSYTTVFTGAPPVETGNVYWNPDATGYRLPTEAEWEYAARAGSRTAFANGGITFYDDMNTCNDDSILDAMGWYCYNNDPYGPKPVAQKEANHWDLFDMHGNVWEWCWDWYGPYTSDSISDPQGPLGSFRVIRGGSWDYGAHDCRSAYRYGYGPGGTFNSLGFRLVLSSGQ